MESKRMSTGVVVLITTLVIALIGTISFIVYDKVIKKEEVKEPITNEENKPSNEVVKKEINVEIKNNMFYVNNNKVDFYSVSDLRNNYTDESSFYCANGEDDNYEPTAFEYKVLDNFVFAKFKPCRAIYAYSYYLVDENGKIMKKINGQNADIKLSIDHEYINVEKVEGNSIYLSTKEYSQYVNYTVCDKITNGQGNEGYKYIDKITYNNGEFKVEKAVETITYNEYKTENAISCN